MRPFRRRREQTLNELLPHEAGPDRPHAGLPVP